MRAIDIFIRVLMFATAIGWFFLPDSVSWKMFLLTFFATGLWCVLYPPGLLGWVSRGRIDRLDPSDPSVWWIPRFIVACFIAASIFGIFVIK